MLRVESLDFEISSLCCVEICLDEGLEGLDQGILDGFGGLLMDYRCHVEGIHLFYPGFPEPAILQELEWWVIFREGSHVSCNFGHIPRLHELNPCGHTTFPQFLRFLKLILPLR